MNREINMTSHGKEEARPVAPSKSTAHDCCGGRTAQAARSDRPATADHVCVEPKSEPTAKTGTHKESHAGCCGTSK